MSEAWVGVRRVAVIPAIVNDTHYPSAYKLPPPEWVTLIKQRLFYDPDPLTGVDRSLRAYYHTVSYGKAWLEAHIFDPVVVAHSHCAKQTEDAINATVGVERFEYACVLFAGGSHPCDGWAFYPNTEFPFTPVRSGTNALRNWCYLSMESSLGVWAMELLHCLTEFGDLYNTSQHPGAFDEMACNCGTHPSSYTKLALGWLDPRAVATFAGTASAVHTIHALSLLQPPISNRVTAVKIPSSDPQRYFLLEARLRTDPYERSTAGISSGIPSEGVVVYAVQEDDPVGSPLRLLTPMALNVGQKLRFEEAALDIVVMDAVPGGFRVMLTRGDSAECAALRREMAVLQQEIINLEGVLRRETDANRQKVAGRLIEGKQAQVRVKDSRLKQLGCTTEG